MEKFGSINIPEPQHCRKQYFMLKFEFGDKYELQRSWTNFFNLNSSISKKSAHLDLTSLVGFIKLNLLFWTQKPARLREHCPIPYLSIQKKSGSGSNSGSAILLSNAAFSFIDNLPCTQGLLEPDLYPAIAHLHGERLGPGDYERWSHPPRWIHLQKVSTVLR